MAVMKSKGTLMQLEVATVMTTVAQCIELTPPGYEADDFESMTLDQIGIGQGRELTGYVKGDDVDAELFWDPTLAVQTALLELTTTPKKGIMQVLFVNQAASEIDFTVAGTKFKPVVKMADGVKAKWSGKIDGLPSLTV